MMRGDRHIHWAGDFSCRGLYVAPRKLAVKSITGEVPRGKVGKFAIAEAKGR
jgi:hypothetical protein